MNELLALFEKELRIEAEVPGFTREETDYVVRHISNHMKVATSFIRACWMVK